MKCKHINQQNSMHVLKINCYLLTDIYLSSINNISIINYE